MQVLKHEKSGRFFIATPQLLKNKRMIPATDKEAEEYIGAMSEELVKQTEDHPSTAKKITIPDDVDPNTDISKWGKPELVMLANRLGMIGVARLGVGMLRETIVNALVEVEARTVDGVSDDGPTRNSDNKADVDYSEGIQIPEDMDVSADISKWSKPDLLEVAAKIGMTGVSRLNVGALKEELGKVFHAEQCARDAIGEGE